MTLRMLDARLWLIALVFALAAIVGNGWAHPDMNDGRGPAEYPVCDSGRNWLVQFFTPIGDVCTRGGMSQDELDARQEERGIADMTPGDAVTAFRELLSEIARAWGVR